MPGVTFDAGGLVALDRNDLTLLDPGVEPIVV